MGDWRRDSGGFEVDVTLRPRDADGGGGEGGDGARFGARAGPDLGDFVDLEHRGRVHGAASR